ncbi:MAG: GNAT family N-acetyltransferase [Deltaproteobacteria bacterium]|nr:GNAT family N-acetyltransferase [Deltaproteobacteria bacterium]
MLIGKATPRDRDFLEELAAEAFRAFGSYGKLLRGWSDEPGVHTYIARSDQERVGFVMLGFYYSDHDRRAVYGDVLAIAVSPTHRGHGVGRLLLRHAVETAYQARRTLDVREVRLSVADTNTRAQKLFLSEGFSEGEEARGRYDGGQEAIRMVLKLAPERMR